MTQDEEDQTNYKVVVNHEEQYSIWPAHRENASGWKDAGKQGTKAECLAYIREVWTDMRPLSLRRRMAEHPAAPAPDGNSVEPDCESDPLIDRLSTGSHPVSVARCGESAAAFRESIERSYVHIRFAETGTELGVRLDSGTDLGGADFANGKGTVRLTGKLTLNYIPVRCVAEVDLGSLKGSGRLDRLANA